MPVLGLGTAGASGRTCIDAVREALNVGYRLIDTASMYGNEREVGIAVKDSGIPREEIFVTTKIASPQQGPKSTPKALDESLHRLGLDYVDLYLIHWPARRKRVATWEAMIPFLDQGTARAIGVSNFMVQHLEELRVAIEILPAVNQIELSPFLHQHEIVTYCHERRIHLEAYSPLTRGRRLRDPTIVGIAAKYGRTPAQVLIRWSLQQG
ncbi:MAG: aldo/keto reductase, partial [Thermoplasmata archaeon]